MPSPHAISRTIGRQLKESQSRILGTKPPVRQPLVIFRVSLSSTEGAMEWAATLERPGCGIGILSGTHRFKDNGAWDPEERYDAATRGLWNALLPILETIRLDSATGRISVAAFSHRIEPVIRAVGAPWIDFEESVSDPQPILALGDILEHRNRKRKAQREALTGMNSRSSIAVATDGSVGFGGASSAFVGDDGTFQAVALDRTRAGRNPLPVVAELWAVVLALSAYKDYLGKLWIRTDSRATLEIIEALQAGRSIRHSGAVRSAVIALDVALANLKAQQIRFEWVRGHSGDPLNEIADELAVLARRHAQAGIDAVESRTRMRSAVEAALKNHVIAGGQKVD